MRVMLACPMLPADTFTGMFTPGNPGITVRPGPAVVLLLILSITCTYLLGLGAFLGDLPDDSLMLAL